MTDDGELQLPMLSMTPFTLDAACNGIGRANVLTGFFIDVLRQLFAADVLKQQSELQKIIWSGNDGGGILIDAVANWKPTAGGQRPALLVKRGDYKTERVTIGDAVQSSGLTPEGNQRYAMMWLGSHTIFALSTNSLQAEALAHEASRHLMQFQAVIRRNLGLVRLMLVDVAAQGILEEAHQTFVTPINLLIAFTEHWIVEQQAPPLRGVLLSSLLQQSQ